MADITRLQTAGTPETSALRGEIFVNAEEISCVYQKGEISVVALDSATCQVQSGDRIAVIGPSGSGKSTLLHVLGGLETPSAGSITWPALGPCQELRPREIGFVFQMESLLAPLTCLENVKIPLILSQVEEAEAHEAAFYALKNLELEKLADKLPEELSGGQAQRVAVARAIVCQPKLILADEPTGQLDHPTAEQLLDLLFASLKDTDAALVIATHDMAVAGRFKTVWHMEHGRLEVHRQC